MRIGTSFLGAFVGILWTARGLAAPVVTVTSPVANAGAALNGSVNVAFSVPVTERVLTDYKARFGANTAPKSWFSCSTDAVAMRCQGSVLTTGVPRGPAPLTVEVTDSFGEVGSASVSLRVDEAPVVAVARPSGLWTQSSVTLRCADAGLFPCASIRVERRQASGGYAPVATGATSVALALAALDGLSFSPGELRAVAVDTLGIETVAPLRPVVDLTPGISPVSRVDGDVVDVNQKFVLFSNATGSWIRDRQTGVDTRLGPNPGGWLTDEGAIFQDAVAFSSYWAGAFTRDMTGLPRDFAGAVARNGRLLAYGGSAAADLSLCYVRDLSTGVETVAADLTPSFGPNVLCRGASVSPAGTLYYQAQPLSGAAGTLVRVAGGTVTPLFAPSSKRWVVADDAGHVAYAATRPLPSSETSLFLDGVIVASGMELAFRDGILAFSQGPSIKLRLADGSVVDRSVVVGKVTDLGPAGELGIAAQRPDGVVKHYLTPVTATPTLVAGGAGALKAVGAGWLLIQADTVRCARAPCGPVNALPPEPEDPTDAGVPSDASSDADADGGPVVQPPGSDAGPVIAPPPPPEDGGCSATGRPESGFGALILCALVALAARFRRARR